MVAYRAIRIYESILQDDFQEVFYMAGFRVFWHGAAIALTMGISVPALAADAANAVDQQIRNSLKILLPNLQPDTIRGTVIPGLYEVSFGARVVYVTSDGRYLLQGKLTDLETRTAITDERLQELKRDAIAQTDPGDMISYAADDPDYTITVFTDIDCGYCRKLHKEMSDYNDAGISVRYMAYPRAGIDSPSYKTAVSVWCADDRKAAMDKAKAGISIEPRSCDNPVAAQYKLGQEIGISGTPALVLEDGRVLPGYVPAARLRAALDRVISR